MPRVNLDLVLNPAGAEQDAEMSQSTLDDIRGRFGAWLDRVYVPFSSRAKAFAIRPVAGIHAATAAAAGTRDDGSEAASAEGTPGDSRENQVPGAAGGPGSPESLQAILHWLEKIEREAPTKPSIREDVHWLREAAIAHFGPPAEVPEESLHRLMHALPVDLVEATVQLGIRRAANARLMAKWYADRLIFLVTAEKASSTLHEIAIRDMQLLTLKQEANFGIQRGLRYGPTEPAYRTLHGLLPLYAPDGGVLRGTFLPSAGNARFIEELGSRTALLCRHPADRLVARGCMTEGGLEAEFAFEQVETGEAFQILITNHRLAPSLHEELNWLTGWLEAFEQSDRFLLLRYEDMMADAPAHFDRLHRFVAGQPMTAEVWELLQSRMTRTKGGDLQPGNRAARHYPKGYSGKVGVWRDYLTPENIAAYNQTVDRFMKYHPRADLLAKVYPNIYLE
jgi:hypothetical protein